MPRVIRDEHCFREMQHWLIFCATGAMIDVL